MPSSMPPRRAAGSASRSASSRSRAADLRIEAEQRRAGRGPRQRPASRAPRRRWTRCALERGARESELATARAQPGDADPRVPRRRARRSPASPPACGRSRSSTPRAPSTVTAPASSLRNRTATSARWVRSPTISKSDAGYERAVEACLGDLLQHVVVRTHEEAAAGLRFASERNAGRVGFLVAEAVPDLDAAGRRRRPWRDPGAAARPRIGAGRSRNCREHRRGLDRRDRRTGQGRCRRVLNGPVATADGIVYRGPAPGRGWNACGGARHSRDQARDQGTPRTPRIEPGAVDRLREEIARLDVAVAAAESAIATVQGELHRQEKDIVGFQLQARASLEAVDRLDPQAGSDRRRAADRRRGAARAAGAPGRGAGVDPSHRGGTARR